MNRSGLLKTLFLGTALSVAGYSHAQTLQPDTHTIQQNKKRTGYLLIQGPEVLDSARLVKLQYEDIATFKQNFAGYPHRVIGSPEQDLDLKEVGKGIKQMTDSLDQLLVFIAIHGERQIRGKELPARESSIPVLNYTENTLSTNITDFKADTVTSTHLFKTIADNWNHQTVGVISHGACYGSSGAEALTQIPSMRIITLSDPGKTAYDLDNQFFKAVNLKTDPPAKDQTWQDDITQKLILHGMAANYKDHPVNMRIFTTGSDKARQTKLNSEKISFGIYDGYMVDCDLKRLSAQNAVPRLLAMAKDQKLDFLGAEKIPELIAAYHKGDFVPDDVKGVSSYYRGALYTMAYMLGQADKRHHSRITQYAIDNKLLTLSAPPVEHIAPALPTPENFIDRYGIVSFIRRYENH